MLGFLKVFGRGILVTLLLPIIVLIIGLYGVYCIILFIFMFFKGVVDFFSGKNFTAELPEDLEARRMVLEKEKADAQAKEMLNLMYQQALAKAGFNPDGLQSKEPDILMPNPEPKPEQKPEQTPETATPINEGENK